MKSMVLVSSVPLCRGSPLRWARSKVIENATVLVELVVHQVLLADVVVLYTAEPTVIVA